MKRRWNNGGNRHERGYGARWVRLRAHVLARDRHLCQPCKARGRLTPAKEVDHITPKYLGGDDSPNNLQAICRVCHRAKTLEEATDAKRRQRRPRIGIDGWPVDQ